MGMVGVDLKVIREISIESTGCAKLHRMWADELPTRDILT